MDEDDWLNPGPSSGQGSSTDPLVEQEYQRLATRYSDAGYREGITDGKLSTLQEGFDQSFSSSVGPSRRIGKLRGRANGLLAHLVGTKLSSSSRSRSASPAPATVQATASGSSLAIDGSDSRQARAALVEDVRDFIRDLGRVKRTEVLPPDHEMEAHEREAHGGGAGEGDGGDDDGFELVPTDQRETEALEGAMDGLGGARERSGGASREGEGEEPGGLREEQLLGTLEARLRGISTRAAELR